jgi:molybdopterin-binding protein
MRTAESYTSDCRECNKLVPGIRSLDTPVDSRYDLPMRLSARNHLVGTIEELQVGDIVAHVVVRISGDHIIESVITRRSVEEMHLKVGDTVAAIIKSTEVMLQKA